MTLKELIIVDKWQVKCGYCGKSWDRLWQEKEPIQCGFCHRYFKPKIPNKVTNEVTK